MKDITDWGRGIADVLKRDVKFILSQTVGNRFKNVKIMKAVASKHYRLRYLN
jgi:hypothetical protein